MRILFTHLCILFPLVVFAQYDDITYYTNGNPQKASVTLSWGRTDYEWYENGSIRSEIKQIGGREYERQEYYENGILRSDSVFEAPDLIAVRCYHPNGQMSEYAYHSNAYQRSYSPVLEEHYKWNEEGHVIYGFARDTSGKVMLDKKLDESEYTTLKLVQEYYPDSMLRLQGFYRLNSDNDTVRYGAWMYFFPDGKLAQIGYWNSGQKWGAHYVLDENSRIVQTEYYENGQLVADNKEYSFVGDFSDERSSFMGMWRKWCRDGLCSGTGSGAGRMYYYYKGLDVCGVPTAENLKTKKKDNRSVFNFPYMEYWSTWNYYRVGFHKDGTLHQRSFSVDGSWGFFEVYDEHGVMNYQRPGANMRENSFWGNGTIMESILKEELPCLTGDCSSLPSLEVDTAYYYSSKGLLQKKVVYGWYGGIKETWERKDSTWVVTEDPAYCALYVEYPNGKRLEIKTRSCDLPGKWMMMTRDGHTLEMGKYVSTRQGEWKTYYPDGTLQSVRNYRDGEIHGYATDFYANGNMKSEGWLDREGEQFGVWKFFDEDGKMTSRYFMDHDGDQWGLVFDGCYYGTRKGGCIGAWGMAFNNFRIMLGLPQIHRHRPTHWGPKF